jgi:hypothetical protein
VAALASVRTGAAQVLLARHDRAAPGARPLEVELALVGLEAAFPGAERVLVSAALLPDSGEAPLPEPQALPRQEAAVGPGPVSVRVGALRPHEALIVKVTAG